MRTERIVIASHTSGNSPRVRRETVRVTEQNVTILCSGCGAASKLRGAQAVAKWGNRPFFCLACGGNPSARSTKPLCTCGHRKYRHTGRRGACEYGHRGKTPCPCTRYAPAPERGLPCD